VLLITSLAVALVALALATVATLALVRTRRNLSEIRASLARQQEQANRAPSPAPTTELAVVPKRYEPTPVVLPSSEQVLRAAMHRPLVRAVTVTYGLRRALQPQNRDRLAALVRREFRRRRRLRQRAGRRAARLTRVGEPS